MIGKMMSETSELAQAVKEAARLRVVSTESWCRESRTIHEADSYFEHVVAQRKVAERVPGTRSASAYALLRILEIFPCVLVQAGHRDVVDVEA